MDNKKRKRPNGTSNQNNQIINLKIIKRITINQLTIKIK